MSKSADTVAVVLDRPGIQSAGEYLAGKVYHVSPKEAQRLIEVKVFRKATANELKQES